MNPGRFPPAPSQHHSAASIHERLCCDKHLLYILSFNLPAKQNKKPVDSLVAPASPLSHGVPVDAHISPGEPLWEAVSDSQLPPLGASAAMHPRHAFPGLLCDNGARAFCVQRGALRVWEIQRRSLTPSPRAASLTPLCRALHTLVTSRPSSPQMSGSSEQALHSGDACTQEV